MSTKLDDLTIGEARQLAATLQGYGISASGKPSPKRTVIVTSQYRDLYYGEITATDEQIIRDKAVRVSQCRHIGYWKCATEGGLTSLAKYGPTSDSRIAAPAPSALLTGVAHVLDVTELAAKRFAEVAND